MKILLLSIMIASACNAQTIDGDKFIDKDGNVGRNILQTGFNQSKFDIQTGEDAWQFLSEGKKKILEKYAKTCYRNYKNDIWTSWFSTQIKRLDEDHVGDEAPWFFNLNEKFGGSYTPVAEDAEPISAQELLGAMINSDVEIVKFIRGKKLSGGPVKQRVLKTNNGRKTAKNRNEHYEYPANRGRRDNQVYWKYKDKTVRGSTYEIIWNFRKTSFPLIGIKKRLEEYRKDQEKKDEAMDSGTIRSRQSTEIDESDAGEGGSICDCCSLRTEEG